MKELSTYIKECLKLFKEGEDQTIRLNDFECSWQVKDPINYGGTFILELPEDYNDDEVSQYLNDMMLESMPTDEDLAKDFFGKGNADNIIDARFEYEDKKEVADKSKHTTLEYDKSIDDQYKGSNVLKRYELKNLRFIVDFEYFDVTNTSDDGLMYDLWDIFKRTKSSINVKYMNDKVKLDISEKDLVFDNSKSELVK